MIYELIFFILYCLFFLMAPGATVLKLLKIEEDDQLIFLGLALTIGIVSLTLWALLIRALGIPWQGLWILTPALLIVYRLRNRSTFQKKIFSRFSCLQAYSLVLILFGVIAQCLTLWVPLKHTSVGVLFPALHDTLWNIALSVELTHHFPPQNPAFAGVLLTNTHYFYPLFIAATQSITRISIIPLYYYFSPALVSIVFGLGLYAVCKIFLQSSLFRVLGIFLGFLMGNFAFLLPLFRGSAFDWHGNSFFADQPFDQLTNPYTVFGFVVLLYGAYLLYRGTKVKISFKPLLLSLFLLGTVYGFKSFAGVIALGTTVITFVLLIIIKRKIRLGIYIVVFLLFFIPVLLLITKPSTVTLRRQPGWLLTEMMVSQDKLNLPQFSDITNYYKSIGSWRGLIKITGIELAIYTVGNLGLRIVGAIFLPIYLVQIVRKKQPSYQAVTIFIASIIILGFVLPLLFNLGGSAHNIIQFTPYALLFLVFPTLMALERFYTYLHKTNALFGVGLIVVSIALAIPVNVKNIMQKIGSTGNVIPYSQLETLDYLKSNTPPESVVATELILNATSPIYLAALGERRTFLVEEGFATQTGVNPEMRKQLQKKFFSGHDYTVLLDQNVNYIYQLKKPFGLEKEKIPPKPYLTMVFENDSVRIYKYGK